MAIKNKKKTKLKGKKARLAAELKAKRIAAKGDGTFPDKLVVTREKEKVDDKTKHWFLGHGEDLGTIYKDETVVAVYKLVRVSKIIIKKKIALNRG
jgi:hypothetical protein